jgi:hypothetical protein
VGKKTQGEMDSNWLDHFLKSNPSGRPPGEGWMTISEMCEIAKVSRSVIDRYLKNHSAIYQTAEGTVSVGGTERRAKFFRKK